MARATPLICKGPCASEVTDISFSGVTADGSFFATASRDGSALLRQGETGDWVGTFSGHRGALWTCDIDPTATRLVTASADYTARVWDCVNGRELRKLDHGQVVRCSVLVPESHQLVTLGYKRVRVWDLRERASIECVSAVSTERDLKQVFVCQEDSQLIYATDSASHISLMEARSGQIVQARELPGLRRLSLSEDGMLLLAAHGGGVAALCEVSLELMREFPTSEGATHAALHPSKGAIASCHAPGSIRVTEFDTRETLRVYSGREGASCLCYSPDGEILAAGTGPDVFLWPHSPGKRYGLWIGRNS